MSNHQPANFGSSYGTGPSSSAPSPVSAEQWIPPVSRLKERSIGVCILLYIATFSIYQLYWWYCVHNELPRRQGKDDSAGVALGGYMLILLAGLATGGVSAFQALSNMTFDGSQMGFASSEEMRISLANGITYPLVLATILSVFGAYWTYRIGGRLTDRVNILLQHENAGQNSVPRFLVVGSAISGFVAFGLSIVDMENLWISALSSGALSLVSTVLLIIWWVMIQSNLNFIVESRRRQASQPAAPTYQAPLR